MSDDKNQSIQMDILDDIMDNITNLYKYCISLEERIGNLEVDTRYVRETFDKFYHDIGRLKTAQDDMETDIDLLYAMTHSCDNFCGNCEHCVSCPDGLYRCDLTNLELDPDSASCIRFKCPQVPKSDAEICKACSDKGTPRCCKCSHFSF